MPPPHLRLPPPFLLPRRGRLLSTARHRSLPPNGFPALSKLDRTSPAVAEEDDFYSLLLSQPLAHPAPESITPHLTSEAPNPLSTSKVPLPSTTETEAPKIRFSMPLAGPSARMRGLARGEKGLDRPPEPDNCCMSGCVNCVWEAYREEVEEWARAKKRREQEMLNREEGMREQADVRYVGRAKGEGSRGSRDGGAGLGYLDDEEKREGFKDLDLNMDQDGLFDDVPVGMREFMATEKRLRERRERRLTMEKG